MTYRIRTASEMTGIPRNTLIAWERRYGFVRPARHGNSYRSYSEADIAKLIRVKNAINSGLSVSEAIEMLDDANNEAEGGKAAASLEGPSSTAEHSEQTPSTTTTEADADPLRAIRSKLYEALIHYRAGNAERLFTELIGVAGETRIHEVFFPILRRIGDEWQAGKLSVAQEHYAATALRDQMVSMLVAAGQRSGNEPHAACTSFPDDLHELAALALAVRLSHAGFRVSYLGPNLPVADLGGFCVTAHPKLVCVSAILRREPAEILAYASSLRAAVPRDTRLVIGGCGVDLEPKPQTPGVELIPKWNELSLQAR